MSTRLNDMKTILNKTNQGIKNIINFHIVYHTEFGQNLFLTGNHELFGNGDIKKAIPLHYLNDGIWTAEVIVDEPQYFEKDMNYYYLVQNADGSYIYDADNDRKIKLDASKYNNILLLDTWNNAGSYENVFYTEAFKNVLFKHKGGTHSKPTTFTHLFRVKTPILAKGETLCLLGSNKALTEWNKETPILMYRTEDSESYEAYVDLTNYSVPFAYKYGIYNNERKKFIRFEDGNNRILDDAAALHKLTIINDGFVHIPLQHWKGTGVAIPVFSLRSKDSWGIGEFNDIKLLADWGGIIGLKLIQLLPVNDTTANQYWTDSYPYSAISAFALHPIYLHIPTITNDVKLIKEFEDERVKLNQLTQVDYEAVLNLKWEAIYKLYSILKEKVFAELGYQTFYNCNKHWLVPYAIFCYLRDTYGTSQYDKWPVGKTFQEIDIEKVTAINSGYYDDIAIHYFIQYQLHTQLKEATDYTHSKHIVLKGDIPIGIYRYGVDAWQNPDLYFLNEQAGAPPDDFAVKGQNWGFPTYNWARMKEDGFAWWKQRFEQMAHYFDAFRIDHILGFFRIWSIPLHSVEGIMGHFEPAVPIRISELNKMGINFDYLRFTNPFITEEVLNDLFGEEATYAKINFLTNVHGQYSLKEEFNTQQKVERFYCEKDNNEINSRMKLGLFNLISNVILFEVEGSGGTAFHFRFSMESTLSFKCLGNETKWKLKELYVNYFFRRQEGSNEQTTRFKKVN